MAVPNSHPLEVLSDTDREARCAAALALVLVDNMRVIELAGPRALATRFTAILLFVCVGGKVCHCRASCLL